MTIREKIAMSPEEKKRLIGKILKGGAVGGGAGALLSGGAAGLGARALVGKSWGGGADCDVAAAKVRHR